MRNCCWKYIILILLPAFNLIAQDYSWWNETHQWDGQSHWSSYMKVSPALWVQMPFQSFCRKNDS